MNTFVSIVLPYYNGSRFVKEAIDSIVSQTFPEYECLIIDDGSPAKEESLFIKELVDNLHDSRFKYIYKINGGLSDARNFGIKNARGKYIAFIDQDDYWKPTKLEKQIQIMSGNADAEFVFTDMDVLPIRGDIYRMKPPSWFKNNSTGVVEDSYRLMLRGNIVPCASVLFKKDLIEKSGYSKKGFTVCPDYELFVRMAQVTNFYYIHEPLYVYRLHDANTTIQIERALLEITLILFGSKTSSFGEKIAATENFVKTMLKLARLWIRKIFVHT